MSGPSPPPAQPIPSSYGGASNYIPSNQAGIDTSYQQLFAGLQGAASPLAGLAGDISGYLQNIQNNPYAGQVVPGAVQAQAYAQGTQIPALQQAGATLTGLGQQAAPYAANILQQGFDPQQALYQQQQQQTTEQANAINSMYGLGSSPAGAGLTQQALQNFNLGWQNQQLGREATAAGAYGNLGSQISGLETAGTGLMGQATGAISGASQLPYSAYNLLQTTPIGAIGAGGQAASSALGPTMGGLGSSLAYLGQGTGASNAYNTALNAAYANQLQNYQAQQQAYQSALGGLGSGIGGIFDQFGQGGAFGTGGAFASLFL